MRMTILITLSKWNIGKEDEIIQDIESAVFPKYRWRDVKVSALSMIEYPDVMIC